MQAQQIKLIGNFFKPEQLIGKVSSEEQVKPCIEWYLKTFCYSTYPDFIVKFEEHKEDEQRILANVYVDEYYSNSFEFSYYPIPEIDPHLKHWVEGIDKPRLV